jgi:hypothetical protein
MRPSGYGPLNNDTDKDDYRQLMPLAEQYAREDWRYILTNGREGEKPDGLPSRFFPWAGQLITRSGWQEDAQWAFFDMGPMGTGHYHRDKLHLSVHAGGRDLLVDSGRYGYIDGPERQYIVDTIAHNCLLVDGHGQRLHEYKGAGEIVGQHAIHDDYDCGRGVFDSGFEGIDDTVVHTRAVVYVRDQFWIVVDRVDLEQPHTVEWLWHWHPECTVAVDRFDTMSVDPEVANLRVTPVGGENWEISLYRGTRSPLQGWYSSINMQFIPATAAVYRTRLEKSATVAWVLTPGAGLVQPVQAKMLSTDDGRVEVEVEWQGNPIRLAIPLVDEPVVEIWHP